MSILRDINNHIFTPHDCLENWLRTHKRPYVIAGLQLPGLFNSDKYTFHLIMFMIALCIETTGTLILALPFGAGLGFLGAMIGGCGFLIDFGIAFILLFPNNNICYFKNYRILYGTDDGAVAAIDTKIRKIERGKNFGKFIIFAVAGVKIYFLKEGFGILEMPVFVMAFLFLVAALIHVLYTEYFFAFYLKFYPAAIQDKNSNINMGQQLIEVKDIFTTSKITNFQAIPNRCPHSITSTDEKVSIKLSTGDIEDRYKSMISMTGIITDNDFVTLCRSQTGGTQQKDLAIELLYLQLDNVALAGNFQNFVAGLPIHRQQI